jgi:hypothetical protein
MKTGFAAQKRLLEEAERIRKEREAASPGSPLGDYFRDLTPEQLRAREAARVAAVDAARRQGATVAETYTRDVAGRPGGVASLSVAQMLANDRAQENPLALTRPSQQAPAAAPAREKGALELTLDGIREERARSAEDKKQNALLALMQAGFAMAAGRSPNAISNIGAGGQAGIAAFAQLERARREDASALRRDELAVRLAQAKMAEDPETVKLFKALGGGDLMKGFELYNSDKKLQAAAVLFKEPLASDEAKKDAERYIQSQIAKARGAGGYPGFSATAVPTR